MVKRSAARAACPTALRRALVGAPAAIGAGVEVQHVLPGEVFELLDAEGRQLVELLVGDAPSHRLERAAVQLGEVDAEQGCLDVELDAERPVAQQEEEGELVHQVGAVVEALERAAEARRAGICAGPRKASMPAERLLVKPPHDWLR